ncbi:MAG: hypothetical protein GX383_07185, partial [Clostridium sp.]|nr:hypothetical protein [Clostridium sp.]
MRNRKSKAILSGLMVIVMVLGQLIPSFAVDEMYNRQQVGKESISSLLEEIQIENKNRTDDEAVEDSDDENKEEQTSAEDKASSESTEKTVVEDVYGDSLETGQESDSDTDIELSQDIEEDDIDEDESEDKKIVPVEDPDTGIIAWYTFDGNTMDLINNYNSAVSENVNYTDGVFGQGVELDGNSFISLGDLEMNSSHRTISLWVSPYKNNGSMNILSKHGSKDDTEVLVRATDKREYFTQINVGEKYYDLRDEASKGSGFISNYDLITETFDGKEIRLYVNGVLKIKRAASGEIYNNDYPLVIGTDAYSVGSEGYFEGCIDDLRIYNRALSSDEVRQLYDEAKEQLLKDDISPDAPKNLEIKSKKSNEDNLLTIELSWFDATDNIGVTGYLLYCNGEEIADIRETGYVHENLPKGEYIYTVKAYDAFYNLSSESNPVFCDNVAPTAPSNLLIESKTYESVVLKWDASTDNKAVAGYKVFCNDVETALVTETNYTYYLNQGEKDISFFVKAYDEEGNESEKSNILIFENVPPEKPSDLKVVKRKHNSIQLSWSPSEDNVGVVLYYVYLDSEFMGETDKTTYTVTGLSADTQYTFSVRAIDGSANISEESSISSMTLISPVYLKSDTVLDGDRVYEGDLYIQGGTIDLNGYKLEVKGDLIQTGGTLYINGGQLEVEGDYRIENNGDYVFAYLKMVTKTIELSYV